MTSHQEAVKSQLNTSTSKQQYSFAKTKRFEKDRIQTQCQVFYDIGAPREKRSTSFGFGQKSDLTKQYTVTPGPAIYNHSSDFESSKFKGQKGIGFGLGRQQIKFNSPFKISQSQPGPGKYETGKSKLSNISFTMSSKIPLTDSKYTNKFSPSPCQYKYEDQTSLSKSGRYMVSRYKSHGVAIINPAGRGQGRALINEQAAKQIPSPQQYQINDDFNPKGSYFIGKYKNSQARSFSQAIRETLVLKSKAPGVGQYQIFSDFGTVQMPNKKK